MKTALFKRSLLASLLFLPALSWAQAQEPKTIKLNEPNKKRGLPVMEALSVRASVREWSDKDLSLQDPSDLLWAANGINRPESKKRTAASAQNAQDVDIYAFMKDGVYLYDASQHALILVAAGDFREEIMMMRPGGGQPSPAPIHRTCLKKRRLGMLSTTTSLKRRSSSLDDGLRPKSYSIPADFKSEN